MKNKFSLPILSSPTAQALGISVAMVMVGFSSSPVQALTWRLGSGSQVETSPTPTPITGSFTIDDENSASPQILFSDIMVGGVTFDMVDNIDTTSLGITAIDWINGASILSLAFSPSALTNTGGTIALNNVSDLDGDQITGSVTSITSVPEPSTLLGAVICFGVSLLFHRRQIN